jgi:hypothetical protein
MRSCLMDARIEGRHFGAHGFECQAQRQAGIRQQVTCILRGQQGDGQRHRAAIDQCRRILGFQVEFDRADTRLHDCLRRAHALAFVHHLCFVEAGNGRSEIGQRCQVAGGANRPFLRHHRMDAGIDEGQQAVDHFDARCRIIAGEGIGAQQHGGARHFFGKRFAHAGSMGRGSTASGTVRCARPGCGCP